MSASASRPITKAVTSSKPCLPPGRAALGCLCAREGAAMDLTTTAKSRYSAVSMLFHWTIAIAVIVNWRIAEAAEHAEPAVRGAIFANHKALGLTIFVLTLGRIAWRLTHPMPALPSNYAKWEWVLARTTHVLFYVF